MLHSYQKTENSIGLRSSIFLDSLYKYAGVLQTNKLLDRIKPSLDRLASVEKGYIESKLLITEKSYDLEEYRKIVNWKNNYILAVFIHIYVNNKEYKPHRDEKIGAKVELIHQIPLGLSSFYIPEFEQHLLVEDAIKNTAISNLKIAKHAQILVYDIEKMKMLVEKYKEMHKNLNEKMYIAEEIVDKLFIYFIDKKLEIQNIDLSKFYESLNETREKILVLDNIIEQFNKFLNNIK